MPRRKSRCPVTEMPDLPEPILQHILSFLDYANVIRATAVSKAWKKAVSTLQCLNVTDDFVRPLITHDSTEGNASSAMETERQRREKVRSMLISARDFFLDVSAQNFHIQKFRFEFRGSFCSSTLDLMESVDVIGSKYIREFAYEVKNDVSSWRHSLLFAYEVKNDVSSWRHSLPLSLYTAGSLEKLLLGGLKLSLLEVDQINIPSLRELDLKYNEIDNRFLEKLIRSCPHLEIVNIHNCFGFDALKVLGSHQKLKRFELMKDFVEKEVVEKIEIIEAPYLEYFSYWGNGVDIIPILDVAACENLKVLKLTAVCGDNNLLKSLERLISHLNFLEEFSLHEFKWIHGDKGLKNIRISSNSLQNLWLAFFDSPVEVQVDAPDLSEFSYLGFISSNLSFESSSIKAANFVKVETDRIRSDKLVEFLRSFNHYEAVKLDDFAPRHFKVLKHLSHNLDPPLWDIKHLTVGARYSNNKHIPVNLEMLEGLLWMAPHLDTLSFDDLKSSLTFQFVHESSSIFQKVPFISRNNRLIKVKVESCHGGAEGFELKKYHFPDRKFLVGKSEQLEVQVMFQNSGSDQFKTNSLRRLRNAKS